MLRCASILLLAACLCAAQTAAPERLFNHALDAQRRGDLNTAISEYQKLLKLQPSLTAARVNLAAALLQQGQTDEAISNYRIAQKQQPGNVQIAALLGNSLILNGSPGDAIKVLQPVEKAHPENLDVGFLLGEALIHAGRPQEGLQRVQKVALARNDASAWLLAGTTQLKLGDYAKARESLDKGLLLDPSMPGAYTLSGMAHAGAGDEEGAKAAFQKALESDPNDFEANLRLGTILRRQGQFDPARKYLAQAVRLSPSSMHARYQIAQAELGAGDNAAAVSDLETVLHDMPNLLQAHVQLSALYYRLHRPEDGQREREIVDRLLAHPEQQDHHLETDPTLGSEKPGANGAAPSP